MIHAALLAVLRCPETRQPLRQADEGLVKICNKKISLAGLMNVRDELIKRTLEGGLVREDGHILYPIFETVTELLVSDGIPLPAPDNSD